MATLDLATSDTPLRTEHERLMRNLLTRGSVGAPLPERTEDDVFDATGHDPEAVRRAAENWRVRALHEHQSSAVFAQLVPQLIEAEAPLDFKTCMARSAMDELRHAALCMQVVAYLGGEPRLDADLEIAPLPTHEHAETARERALRNVFCASCLSETVSVALLTEERGRCTDPFVSRVLRQLSSDEVLHARIGWLYLDLVWPTLDPAARARFDRFLAPALAWIEDEMLGAMPLSATPIAPAVLHDAHRLGYSSSRAARTLFYDTIGTAILPRLDHLGLDARRAWENRQVGRDLIVDDRAGHHATDVATTGPGSAGCNVEDMSPG